MPRPKGREPEIPVEPRLVGGVDAWSGFQILRLVAEGIDDPGFAVAGALEFDFIALVGHAGEEAVAIGYAEGIDPAHRAFWERDARDDHADQDGSRDVENCAERQAGYGFFQRRECRSQLFWCG